MTAGGQLCEGAADVDELERELIGLAGVAELLVVMGLIGDTEPLVVIGLRGVVELLIVIEILGVKLEDEVGYIGVELNWLVGEPEATVIELLGKLVRLVGV